MLKMNVLLTAAVVLCASQQSAFADDVSFEIKGFGPRPCSDFYWDFFDERVNKELRGWAYGFASGLNVERQRNQQKPKDLKLLTGELVEQEILAYCPDKYGDEDMLGLMQDIYDSLPDLD